MRFPLLLPSLLLLSFSATGAYHNAFRNDPAKWVDKMEAALWPSDAITADATLVTHDDMGAGLDSTLALVRVRSNDQVRMQIRVTAPAKAEGTVYEVSSNGRDKVDRSVYAPAFERTRVLRGTQRADSFLASQFSYEDAELTAPVAAHWTKADKVTSDGQQLIRIVNQASPEYSKIEFLIDAKTSLPVRATYYDRSGLKYKVETFDEVKTIDGHPIPTHIVMTDVQSDAKSELHLSNIQLGAKIDEKVFTDSPIRAHRDAQTTPSS
jgi:outer membrane lipoprotein-sorting protein